MNWGRAKTILIIFFICTNIFLLSVILMSSGKVSIVTDDIVASATLVLKNNGIEIDPEIIPRRIQLIPALEADNFVTGYEEFSEKILGEDSVPQGNNLYESKSGKVAFTGDRFEFSAKMPVFPELTQKLSISSGKQIASDILKKYGFKDNNAVYDIKEEGSMYTVTVSKKKEELGFFNSEIELVMGLAGLTKMSGSWFYEKGTSEKEYAQKSIAGVLIDYISAVNRPQANEKITSIDLGYSILEEGIYHQQATLLPCWKITLEDGQSFVLSASENENI